MKNKDIDYLNNKNIYIKYNMSNTSDDLMNNPVKDIIVPSKTEKDINEEYILMQNAKPDKVIGDTFWSKNIEILYRKDRLTEFYPSYDMTLIEKLNAIARMSIYLSVVLFLGTQNYLYLYIFIVIMAFTLFIYNNQKDNIEMYFNSYNSVLNEHNKRVLDKKKCTQPTNNNPFMNFNVISDKKDRTEACSSWNDKEIKKDVKEKFNHNLYRDVSDLYGKNNSQRQYYTMPSTTMANKQTEFAKWCYNTGPTCKEDTIKCATQWELFNPSQTISYQNLHN